MELEVQPHNDASLNKLKQSAFTRIAQYQTFTSTPILWFIRLLEWFKLFMWIH